MIDNFNFLMLLAAGLILAAVYLPASIELRKPKDNGPRIIESPRQLRLCKDCLVNIEKSETSLLNQSVPNDLGLPLLDDC
jgi:hypothetical protein